MITEEQIKLVKKQLIEHINSTFPEDKKAQAIAQVNAMSPQELEDFLARNQAAYQKTPQEASYPKKSAKSKKETSEIQQGCIFCAIASEKTKSYKIDDNKDSIAVLEINPISKGHTIIIPKNHIEVSGKIPQGAFSLAKKISKKLKSKYKPKEVVISSSNNFGHIIINVLPVYNDETLDSPRQQGDSKELEKIYKRLVKKTKKPVTKKKTPTKKVKKEESKTSKKEMKNIWLPRRIP